VHRPAARENLPEDEQPKRRLKGSGDEFRDVVAQFAQLEPGNDERLRNKAGERVDESSGHRIGPAKSLGRSAFGGHVAEVAAGTEGETGLVNVGLDSAVAAGTTRRLKFFRRRQAHPAYPGASDPAANQATVATHKEVASSTITSPPPCRNIVLAQ
jgi:hypothetical protein